MTTRQAEMKSAVVGDLGDTRTWRLDGVETLLGATNIKAHFWTQDIPVVSVDCTLLDAAARLVEVPLGGFLDAAIPASYSTEVSVNHEAATELTFPAAAPALIRVRQQGA